MAVTTLFARIRLSAPARHAVAVAAALAATLLRVGLDPIWGDKSPFILFYPAVALSAWLGGLWPGLVTTLLAALAAEYLWLEPARSLAVSHQSDLIALLVFGAVGALISALFEALQRAALRESRDSLERARLFDAERQARLAAEAAEHQLRLALEAGRLGTWRWTIATGRVQWSPGLEAIHGLPPGSFPGTFDAVQNEIHPDDREKVARAISQAVEQRGNYLVEYRIVRSDGELRWLEGRGRVSLDSAGRPETMSGVCSDITERKNAEAGRVAVLERERAARAELERASVLKDQFLAVLSHELRTPLSAVMSWTHLLGTGKLSAARTSEAVKAIERSAQAEARLVDSLLDLSRIMAGKLELRSEPVDLAAVVGAAAGVLRPLAEANGQNLDVSLPPASVATVGDAARLQQIVWNLLSNALKFTPKGGHVQVQLSAADGRAEIVVSDDGKGIAAEFLPVIFDRFTQAQAEKNRSQQGLGLGLAIVRELVNAHGGSVAAQSAGPAHGATFTVSLPLRAPASLPSPAGEKAAPVEASASLRKLRVLLVDDEPDAREALCLALEAQGAVVRTAASAGEGFAAVRANPPDVLIADIGMPYEDGYTLIRRVRAHEHEQGRGHMPALALTAYASAHDRDQALTAGFDAHLAKPAAPVDLLQLLARMTLPPGDEPANG